MATELEAARSVAQAVHDTLGGLVARGNGGAFMPEQVKLLRKA
jgi:hypothetical protein